MNSLVTQTMGALALVLVLAVPFGLLVMLLLRVVSGVGRARMYRDELAERATCPDCGQGIDANWDSCAFCGADTDHGGQPGADGRRVV